MRINVVVDTETWVEREPSDTDKWDNGDVGGRVTGVRLVDGLYGFPFEVNAIPGETVFVVVADYESGDTFGREGGFYQILDVFEDYDEARDLQAAAYKAKDFSLTHNGKDYYVSWTGYFEYLQAIEVWPIVIPYGS